MMGYRITTGLFMTLGFLIPMVGYNQAADSLGKAQQLFDKAWNLKDVHADSSYNYAQLALEEAVKEGNQTLVAYSYSSIGSYFKRKENYTEAEKYLLLSLETRKCLNSNKDLASGYNNLGLLYKQMGRYDKAETQFYEGLQVIKIGEHPMLRASLLEGIGMSKLNRGQHEDAVSLLMQAAEIMEKQGDSLDLAKSYQNLGKMYDQIGQPAQSLDYNQKAMEIFQKTGNYNGIADVLINEGGVYLRQGNYVKARENFLRASEISGERGFQKKLATVYYNLGIIFRAEGDLVKAAEYHEKDYNLSVQHGNSIQSIESALLLSELYNLQQQHKMALQWIEKTTKPGKDSLPPLLKSQRLKAEFNALAGLKRFEEAYIAGVRYHTLQDSLNRSALRSRQVADEISAAKREAAQKRNDFILKETELERERAKSRTYLIVVISLLILLPLSVLAVWYKRRNHQLTIKSLLAEQETFRLKEESIKKDEEIRTVIQAIENRMMEVRAEAQKNERKKIARELHDTIGSKLAVVQGLSESMSKDIEGLGEKKYAMFLKAMGILDETTGEVRDMARSIENPEIASYDLETEMREFCELISEIGRMKVNFIAHAVPAKIPPAIHREITAIITTLFHNILRHAEAKEAELQLIFHDHSLRLMIEDNGKGFDINHHEYKPGMGLRHSQERVEALGGEIDIDSSPQGGTVIIIEIPLNETHGKTD